MKRTIIAAIVGIGFAGTAMAADPAVGVWKTQPDDGAYAQVRFGDLQTTKSTSAR